MNLEPIIQSEVSQKEKDKNRILTHIYGIQKNGTEEFTYRTTTEKQTQKIDLWTWGEGGEGEMYGKNNMKTYITRCNRQPMKIYCMAQETQRLCINLEEQDPERDGSKVQEGGDICIVMADSC